MPTRPTLAGRDERPDIRRDNRRVTTPEPRSCPPADRGINEPHPDRLAADHPGRCEILATHAHAVAAGEAGYLDPSTGLFVLTATFLANRGTCCDRGCRHCPYVV
jgi:hypothetical protein